jgi:predicted N-acetyltransferase YhbS
LTILPETPADAVAIERLHERTFGPGRYAKTAYRLREQVAHSLDLSFTARVGSTSRWPLARAVSSACAIKA